MLVAVRRRIVLYLLLRTRHLDLEKELSHHLSTFWVDGPNGKHKCIVTPPARMSLFDAKEASTFGLFRLKVARSIITQLIRGVAFLHSEHIVHGILPPE